MGSSIGGGETLGGLPSGATLGQERHFPGRARDLVLMVGRCTMQGAGLEAPGEYASRGRTGPATPPPGNASPTHRRGTRARNHPPTDLDSTCGAVVKYSMRKVKH